MTDASLRLFVAIEMPEAVLRTIGAFQDELRVRAPFLRWVRPDGAHLTLKFIGNVSPAALATVEEALNAVPAVEPFTLRTTSAGMFGGGRARVLWLGLDGDTGRLFSLQGAVDRALSDTGLVSPDRQPFRPHLTLARVPDSASSEQRRLVWEAAAAAPPESLSFVVAGFALIQSELSPKGARYTHLRRFPARIA